MRKKPKGFEHLCTGCPNEHQPDFWCEEYAVCPEDRRADWRHESADKVWQWSARFLSASRDVDAELSRATARHKPMNSPHEGWAIILEELEELWDEVKVRDDQRSVERMRAEAVQVAAMAMRFIIDICGGGSGADA